MSQNFGNQLVTRETKRGTLLWLRLGAVAAFLFFGVGGVFLILRPFDPEDTIIGFGMVGMAVLLPIVLLVVAKKLRAQITIYEEGVVVQNSGKEHRFHFSEILGLRDTPSAGATVVVPGGFGILGALAAGAVVAVADNVADASRRKHRIRSISIVPVSRDGSPQAEVPVVNTGGDELSEVFTEWLVKQKAITKERIPSLYLSFGDSLTLRDGTLVHASRRGEVRLALKDVTRVNTADGALRLFGLNEKEKEKCLIDIPFKAVFNLDVLFYIFDLKAAS